MSSPTFYYPDSEIIDPNCSPRNSSHAIDSLPTNLLFPSSRSLSSSPASYLSPLSSPSSSESSSYSSPQPAQRKAKSPKVKAEAKTSRRPHSPDHIPRPRNAFMIYRSEFYRMDLMTPDVERDHRIISRVIGMCWKKLSAGEKKIWFEKAAEEKRAHQLKYPDYRFRPQCGGEPKQKRNVKRNGPKELKRCAALADAIVDGQEMDVIKAIAKTYDEMSEEEPSDVYTTAIFDSRLAGAATSSYRAPDERGRPVFRSPLVAPGSLDDQLPIGSLQFTNVEASAGRHFMNVVSSSPAYGTQGLASHNLGAQQPVAPHNTAAWGAPQHTHQHGNQALSSSLPAFRGPPANATCLAPTYALPLQPESANNYGWNGVPIGSLGVSYGAPQIPMPSISNYATSLSNSSTGLHWATTAESLNQLSNQHMPSTLLQDPVDSALFSQW